LSILAYRGIHSDLVQTLLAIAVNGSTIPTLGRAIRAVPTHEFYLAHGHTLHIDNVLQLVLANCCAYEQSAEAQLPKKSAEDHTQWAARKRKKFTARKVEQCDALAELIFGFWPPPASPLILPDITVILPDSTQTRFPIIKLERLRDTVSPFLSNKLRNRRMFESVAELRRVLRTVQSLPLSEADASVPPSTPTAKKPSSKYVPITLASLLQTTDGILAKTRDSIEPFASIPARRLVTPGIAGTSMRGFMSGKLIPRLKEMLIEGPKLQYIEDLSRCVEALEGKNFSEATSSQQGDHSNHSSILTDIPNLLRPKTQLQQLLFRTGQWPSTGPESLLLQLTRELRASLSSHWKVNLSRYAAGLTARQKQRRDDVRSRSEPERVQEVEPRGGWDPVAYPDWLLFQLDADILIRPVQASIALQMIAPESGQNALLQLNMGEGKSSVSGSLLVLYAMS
jgi:hypothetical protein